MKDAGATAKEFKQAASITKLYTPESAVTATRIATQIFGDYSFVEEYPVTRLYRDTKILEIGEAPQKCNACLSPGARPPSRMNGYGARR